jgi:hypothetical protein
MRISQSEGFIDLPTVISANQRAAVTGAKFVICCLLQEIIVGVKYFLKNAKFCHFHTNHRHYLYIL